MSLSRDLVSSILVFCMALPSCVTQSNSGGNLTGHGRYLDVACIKGGTAKVWLGVKPQPNETFKWEGDVDSEGYASGIGSFVTLSSDWGLTTFSTGNAVRGRMEGTMLKYVHWAPQRAVYLMTMENGRVTNKTKVANTLEEWRKSLPEEKPTPGVLTQSSTGGPPSSGSSAESGAAVVVAVAVIAVAAYGVYKLFGGGSSSPASSSFVHDDSGADHDPDDKFYSASGSYVGYHSGNTLFTANHTTCGRISDGTIFDARGNTRGKIRDNTIFSASSTNLGTFSGNTVFSPASTTVGRAADSESADEAAAFFLALDQH